MIILNADDWGRSRAETDAALYCYKEGRITSVTAMVFMEDSKRAAQLAKVAGIDVGLHLNLSQHFTAEVSDKILIQYHRRVVNYLTLSKYSLIVYNPILRKEFQYVYQCQLEEYMRLYGRRPSHYDGHQHMHLCTNMLLGRVIPEGEKVRRSFSFWQGEKSLVNRRYRQLIDQALFRRYRLTNHFFSLSRCLQTNCLPRALNLATSTTVEFVTHPAKADEFDYLMGDYHNAMLHEHEFGTYAAI